MTSKAADTRYDIIHAVVRPRMVPAALERLGGFFAKATASADLLGCWFSELGGVNQILALRRVKDLSRLADERSDIVLDKDPLGISEFVVSFRMDTAIGLPDIETAAPRADTKFFEVRTDDLKPGAFVATRDAWRAAKMAPLFALYASSGEGHRLIHIWPCAALDDRAGTPNSGVQSNAWTRDVAPLIVAQRAEIFRPAAFSPIR
jgi:NIPSNAP protein